MDRFKVSFDVAGVSTNKLIKVQQQLNGELPIRKKNVVIALSGTKDLTCSNVQ